MTTKVQPSVFTFQTLPPAKQYPAVKVNPKVLLEHICFNRVFYETQICAITVFLSKSVQCAHDKVLPFVTQKQLRTIGALFLCILGKKAVPESELAGEANHAISLLSKTQWNSSDRCVFESARVECLQILQSISSMSSPEDQSRITQQLTRPRPSRSVQHLTLSTLNIDQLPIAVLAHIITFVEPKFFIETIPKISMQWSEASKFPLALQAQEQHCKKQNELLTELIGNLKEPVTVITADSIQKLFAKSPFHAHHYRFRFFMLDGVPKVGERYPSFFAAIKKKSTGDNVAMIDQVIWSTCEEHALAKNALIESAADAFEKEMRVPVRSLLPKNQG